MLMQDSFFLVLLAALLVAVLVDQRKHRIPNALTALIAVGGVAAQTWTAGGSGALSALSGMALGLGVFLVPYLMRALGAGDVKLMAAAGAWLGPAATAAASLVTLVVGAGFGVAVLAYRYYASSTGFAGASLAKAEEVLTSRFPYAIAIAIGVSVTFIAKETPWML